MVENDAALALVYLSNPDERSKARLSEEAHKNIKILKEEEEEIKLKARKLFLTTSPKNRKAIAKIMELFKKSMKVQNHWRKLSTLYPRRQGLD
jgi:hypothetical protein